MSLDHVIGAVELKIDPKVKVNESRYIALFVFSKSIKKLFSIDCVNIYHLLIFFSIDFAINYIDIDLFSIFFSIDFARWKSAGLPHIAYIIIH